MQYFFFFMTPWIRRRGTSNKLRRVRQGMKCKTALQAFSALIVTVVWLKINFNSPGRYTGNKPWGPLPKCQNSEQDIDRLVQLTFKVHVILESMGIDCWLMYGSIWGPLRGIEGPLAWDDDVDLAINGDSQFSQMTFEKFKAFFTVAGLSVENQLWLNSKVIISEEDTRPSLDLFVFYDYDGMMKRAGIETWLTPIHFNLYHSFPSSLVEQPLPKVKFGFFSISVPRNGTEIMKYLYRYNWWKVVKPVNCRNN